MENIQLEKGKLDQNMVESNKDVSKQDANNNEDVKE